jgi:pSer/pThr/pTyr-binding forkhead associated (FHA) protein
VVKVIVEDDEGRKTVVPFVREEITIGRQEGNTIRLTERNISRHHARLFRQNGTILVEDLGSYNGIRINGARVEGKVAIHPGDRIQIGDYGLAIDDEGAAHSSATSLAAPPGVNGFSSAHGTAKAAPEIPLPAHAPPRPEGAPERISAAEEQITQETRAKPARELKPEHTARLVLLNTEGAGRQFACTRAELKIGRSNENEFAIEDSSLSPTHARLRLDDSGEWHLIDLSSSHGVLVNGEPYAQATLRSGDLLQLGNVKLRFIGRGAALALGADRAKPRARSANKLKLTVVSLSIAVLAANGLFLLLTSKSAPVVKPESLRSVASSAPAQPPEPSRPTSPTSAPPQLEAKPKPNAASPPQLEAKPKPNASPRRDQGPPLGQDGRRSKEKDPKPTSAARPDPEVREDRPAAPPRPAGAVLQTLYDEGTAHYRNGKFAEAARALKECLKVDPTFPRCHMALGATYARLREPALGAEHYRKFIQLAPNDPEVGKVKTYLEQYESLQNSGQKN